MFKVPNQFRIRYGVMGSNDAIGNYGAFCVPFTFDGKELKINPNGDTNAWIIASDADSSGWEHVSCHCITPDGQSTPTWELMCAIKDLFWDAEDCVIQFHPPKSEYVNVHKHTLHLWRKSGANLETPPKGLIG